MKNIPSFVCGVRSLLMGLCVASTLSGAALGGGTVLFGAPGVLTLFNTMTITQDTVLDANGYNVTISGGNAVRLFVVNSNVEFVAKGLNLANGANVGADAVFGTFSAPGQDGSGAGILNLGGHRRAHRLHANE